jgi:hypothetical protein
MTELSPTAQAVLDAADEAIREWPPIWENAIAAALQAAANELTDASSAHTLYAIAGELNGIPYLSLNQQIPIDS